MPSENKKILLIGHTGQIGTDLASILKSKSRLITAGRSSGQYQVDLTDKHSIINCIQQSKPDLIINTAAYTAVDKAEEEHLLAHEVNAKAPAIIAEQAEILNIPFIHYSTDYVFDGLSEKHYTETDITSPLNQYGKSKLIGEQAVLSTCKTAIILRTSWIYGQHGNNFLLTILRLAKEHTLLRIVADQFGVPTWSYYAAELTDKVIDKMAWDVTEWKKHAGLYHLCPTGETSWYDFTREIISNTNKIPSIIVEEIKPITTEEYPTPAKRPAHSVLDTKKLQDTFSISLESWQQVLKRCMVLIDRA